MPTYEYKCNNCDHSFEIVQSMKDKVKRKCPECKKSRLKRVLGTPFVFVKGEAKTIGHLAERNTEKMGRYELGDKRGIQEEANNKAKEAKGKTEQPWYVKDAAANTREIKKMTPEQKISYIKKGQK